MKALVAIVLVIFFAYLISGCYYDNEEDLYGLGSCTSNPTPAFSSDVLPLLDYKCNNCHSGSSPSGGIRLDTYSEVMKYVNNGKLLGSITQTSGYVAMPKNASKLNPCQIQIIQNWINSGNLNN